jgi:acyl carrier protein
MDSKTDILNRTSQTLRDTPQALTLDREAVTQMVVASLKEVLAMAPGEAAAPADLGPDTRLIGSGAVLDSMGLVTLILEVEQRLEADHGLTVVLADERAMSQKNSPFRSVQSLTDYVLQQVEARG